MNSDASIPPWSPPQKWGLVPPHIPLQSLRQFVPPNIVRHYHGFMGIQELTSKSTAVQTASCVHEAWTHQLHFCFRLACSASALACSASALACSDLSNLSNNPTTVTSSSDSGKGVELARTASVILAWILLKELWERKSVHEKGKKSPCIPLSCLLQLPFLSMLLLKRIVEQKFRDFLHAAFAWEFFCEPIAL